jgi:hypothetical protein
VKDINMPKFQILAWLLLVPMAILIAFSVHFSLPQYIQFLQTYVSSLSLLLEICVDKRSNLWVLCPSRTTPPT